MLVELFNFVMLVVHLCTYFYVYLSQTVSCPPCIGMKWKFFCSVHLGKERHFELMLVTSRVVVPPLPAERLRAGRVRRCKLATKVAPWVILVELFNFNMLVVRESRFTFLILSILGPKKFSI